jgi:uncharacterized membrane protein SpoIIM required for sporulation
MTVRLEDHAIVLAGVCGVEQVEALLAQLEAHPELPVDIGATEAVHTTLWQVMLMMKPAIIGTPGSKIIADHVLPALRKNFLRPNSG